MSLITDRTWEDVQERNGKGYYTTRDLDRVERTVQTICDQLRLLGTDLQLAIKTDWEMEYCVPVRETMKRYLDNVRQIVQQLDLHAELPVSMEHLDWQGANQIELALQQAQEKLEKMLQGRQV